MPIVDTTASLECFFVREAACGGWWEKKGRAREHLQGLAWDCRQGGLVTRVQGWVQDDGCKVHGYISRWSYVSGQRDEGALSAIRAE